MPVRSMSWPRYCRRTPTWSTRWTSPRPSGVTAAPLNACSTVPCAARPTRPCWCSTIRRSLPASARNATCCWNCTALRSNATARSALSPRRSPSCSRPVPANACMAMASRRCRGLRTGWRPGDGSRPTRATVRPCWISVSRRWCRCARKRLKATANCSTSGTPNRH
ncbi:hypothetical protein D3C76_1178760 [compost metagenome]